MALAIESTRAEAGLRQIMALTGQNDIEQVLMDALEERLSSAKAERLHVAVRATWEGRLRFSAPKFGTNL